MMRHLARPVTVFSCVVFWSLCTLGPANAAEVTHTETFAEPVIADSAVLMPGTHTFAVAGSPLLPADTVRLTIPPAIDPTTLAVEVEMLGVWQTRFKDPVAPAPAQLPTGAPPLFEAPSADPEVYGRDAYFPETDYRVIGVSYSHGYAILSLELYPVRWNPVTGDARVAAAAKIRVQSPGSGTPTERESSFLRGLPADRDAVARLVDNPMRLDLLRPPDPGVSDWEYLVVTTGALAPAFETLALHRSNVDGFTTHVATVADIVAAYPGRDDAERVRNAVIDGYQNHGTRYLVLGGDDDVVPMRGCYGRSEDAYTDNDIPTDFYFGALDGDWNADGDSIWGEPEDDVDLFAEVAVGRIAAGNAVEAQNQVNKIVAYETWGAAPWHTLLVGEEADSTTWGGDMLDYVYQQMAGVPRDTLYERDGYWSSSTLVNSYFNTGALNVVNHMGHANTTTVMKLSPGEAAGLSNSNPFMIYSQGCYAGAFDDGDCMAEAFTVKGPGGCHAVLMNSRYGWYAPGSNFGTSTLFHREFLQAIYEEHMVRLGDANDLSKHLLAGLAEVYGSVRWCFFDVTLFGDPATPVHWQCTPNAVRIQPESVSAGFTIMRSDQWVVTAAVHTDCGGAVAEGAGTTVEVSFSNGDAAILLHDDGIAPDQTAGDGHFSGLWAPGAEGPVTLSFAAEAAGLTDGATDVTGQVVPWMGYTTRTDANPWVDTSAGATLSSGSVLGTTDDGGWVVDIGFDFMLYGATYSDMMVGTNGLIQMEHGDSYSSTEESFPIPYAGDDNGLVAPWWCDLNPGAGGAVRTLAQGTAPNRVFTVEWHQVPHYSDQGAVTFQASLYEGTNELVFRYADTAFGDPDYDHGADATAGIEGPNGVHAVQWTYHGQDLVDGLAVTYSPISPEGQVLLDAAAYGCSANAGVRVLDADLEGFDQITVAASSETEDTPLDVILVPDGDPRIFTGAFTVDSGPATPDGLLQVSPGDTVTVRYQDANPVGERVATAVVDCGPPIISGLGVTDVGATTAMVNWTTDEPADSSVQASPGSATANDGSLVTVHGVLLEGLSECTSYTVSAASTDAPGNTGYGGPSAPFLTLERDVALADDVESGNSGWTVQTPQSGGPGADWSIVTDPLASSPSHSWFSADEDSVKEDRLIAGPFVLGSGTATLRFNHHYDLEGDYSAYDGGVLEISTDGVTFPDVLAAGGVFLSGGYDDALSTCCDNPLGGREAWTGDSGGLVTTEVDLSAVAGGDLWFRLRLGCDASLGAGGWWIDDIVLETTRPCAGAAGIFADGFEDGDTSAWSATSSRVPMGGGR